VKLWALSDLHVGYADNRRALESIGTHADDWLILGGDVCEREGDLRFVLDSLGRKFAQLIWVPGNHELWTLPGETRRGEAKYRRFVEICQDAGVLTPEDPYVVWNGDGGRRLIAPLFVLYDYTFRPDAIAPEDAVEWARESGVECADEHLLHPDPYPSRPAWCAARYAYSEKRLEAAVAEHRCPAVLINHFPLRHELAVLPRIPRFSIWCGTRRTSDWHTRFGAEVVVFGHLHIRQTRLIDDVRFEEVSLGYPRQWNTERSIDSYLRQILPAPDTSGAPSGSGPASVSSGNSWWLMGRG
jgi:3',5'-cyclic AMP phosphodiesterase CpdA